MTQPKGHNNVLTHRFADLQRVLEADLRASRGHHHPTAAGDHTESNWLGIFRSHLPARYQVDRAFVLDSRCQHSAQIDVVIYDRQYSLLLYNRRGQLYLPAESVYAVLEVKQDLHAVNLRQAAKKIASVRRLHRTNAQFQTASGPIREPKPLPHILGGILCTGAKWRPAFGAPLEQHLRDLSPEARIDLGCVAQEGSFEVGYPEGGVEVTPTAPGTALVSFLLTLLRRLQSVGTVPAIEFPAYERVLQKGEIHD